MEVAKRSSSVRRLFADGAQYAKAVEIASTVAPYGEEIDETRMPPTPRTPRRSGELIELYAGDIELHLPLSASSIGVITSVLNMLKEQLGKDDQGTSSED
jgi:hypothetical protein